MLASDGAVSTSFVDEITARMLPAGTIAYSVASSMGSGWLLADGSEVSRTTYANLFSAIGTRYGSGNGTTTFTLPDLRGRSMIGAGQGVQGGTLTYRDVNTAYAGSDTHSLTEGELAPHSHTTAVVPTARTAAVDGGGTYSLVWRGTSGSPEETSSVGSGTAFSMLHPCLIGFGFIKT